MLILGLIIQETLEGGGAPGPSGSGGGRGSGPNRFWSSGSEIPQAQNTYTPFSHQESADFLNKLEESATGRGRELPIREAGVTPEELHRLRLNLQANVPDSPIYVKNFRGGSIHRMSSLNNSKHFREYIKNSLNL